MRTSPHPTIVLSSSSSTGSSSLSLVSTSSTGNQRRKARPKPPPKVYTEAAPLDLGTNPNTLTDRNILPLYRSHNWNFVLPHDHPRTYYDFNITPRVLTEASYCPLDIATFLASPMKEYVPNPSDEKIINSPIPSPSTDEELEATMQAWFKILDEWMFGSTLSHAGVKIELELNRTIHAFGWFNLPSRTVFINLDPALQKSPLMTGTREEHLISTMLHECVHAFIGIYSCNDFCCVIFRHPSQGGEGSEGHGPVWVDGYATVWKELAAHVPWAVENSLRRGLIGSMCDDLWQPSAEQVKRWELPEDIFGSPAGWGFARGDFSKKVKKIHEKRRELHERDAPKKSAGKHAPDPSKVDEETKAEKIVEGK